MEWLKFVCPVIPRSKLLPQLSLLVYATRDLKR